MDKTLIIEIPYAGLGDHLFHSHLPRIAKETGRYKKVFISQNSPVRSNDYKEVVWDHNPYIDGFINEPGLKCDIKEILKNIKRGYNLLDEIMFYFNLDDGKKMHEPEIYYKPTYIEKYNKTIYDPNFLSWVGVVDKNDMMWFLKKEKIKLDAIMKIRTDKSLYLPKASDIFLETPTLKDFCDLIYSSKKLYCLTSGTATLASAMGKPAIVFFGEKQDPGYQHSKIHTYIKIEKPPQRKFLNFIRSIIDSFKNTFR